MESLKLKDLQRALQASRQDLPTPAGKRDQPKIHATAHNPEATASTTAIK